MEKANAVLSAFQICIGVLAIVSFFILKTGNEEMTKWIPTLILAIGFVVVGIAGLIKKQDSK